MLIFKNFVSLYFTSLNNFSGHVSGEIEPSEVAAKINSLCFKAIEVK